MLASRLQQIRSSQSTLSLASTITNSSDQFPGNSELSHQRNSNMSETFYVTPVSELETLEDWNYPLAFQAAHHHENLNVTDSIEVEWRLRDRVKMNNLFY